MTRESECSGWLTTPHERAHVAAKVVARSRRDPTTGCLVWTDRLHVTGYGVIKLAGYPFRAHRVAWMLAHGPIEEGAHILHHCDNRRCVAVEHLYAGTHLDNMRDRTERKRAAAGMRHPKVPAAVARVQGMPPRPAPPRRRRKITEEQVAEMRALYVTGEWTTRALAARYGLSQGTVAYHLMGGRYSIMPKGKTLDRDAESR